MFCRYLDELELIKEISKDDFDFGEIRRKSELCLSLIVFLQNEIDTLIKRDPLIRPRMISNSWNNLYHIEQSQYTLEINSRDPKDLDIQYEMIALDPDITITKDEVKQNQFNVEYPSYNVDVGMVFFIQLTNSNGDTSLYHIFQTIHAYRIPVIKNIYWDSIVQMSDGSYTMTIDAEGPRGLKLDFSVECDDPNVAIVKNESHENMFHITYPVYTEDKLRKFTIVATNENNERNQLDTFTLVRLPGDVNIRGIIWNVDYQYEQNSYVMTIDAVDSQGLDLYYEVTCNNSGVTIVQDQFLENVFNVTYDGFPRDSVVSYLITVTNEVDVSANRLQAKIVHILCNQSPIINNISWNNDDQWEQHSYTMTIQATDPCETEMFYEVVCDDHSVSVVQDITTPNVFHITYGNYDESVTNAFHITVTNEKDFHEYEIINQLVKAYAPPIIDEIQWNIDYQWEKNSYEMTVIAHDPQGFNITYMVECNDSHVTIEQNNQYKNKFSVTYSNFDDDNEITFVITVTNTDNKSSSLNDNVTVHAYAPPIIDEIQWNIDYQWEKNSYEMTVIAHDPQGLGLQYIVNPSSSSVEVKQNHTYPNKFEITYPNYEEETSIIYQVRVINADGRFDTRSEEVIVHAHTPPIIDSVSWNTDYQWEQGSYDMTIHAHDPQDLDIVYYSVTCNHSGVIVVQDSENPNVFHVTYPDIDEDNTIYYHITITNEDNLSTYKTEAVDVHSYVPPIIDSITWNENEQWEQHTYIMTIHAHDPQGLNLTYSATSNNSEVSSIIQDTNDPNVFHVTYGNVNDDTSISIRVEVTDQLNLTTHTYTSVLVKAYVPPVINGVTWNDTNQWEQHTYTMTIDATDPQGLDLTYQVTCSNSGITINQDTSNENKFHVTYPNLSDDDTIYYTITVTNEDNLTDDTTEHIQVKAYVPPVINGVTWNDMNQWEQRSYTMTIDATDPQGLDLTYQVTCNRSNVIINQDTTNKNVFHITYPDMDDDDTIYYYITVTNEDNLANNTTENIQVKAYVPPVINEVSWNSNDQWEQHTYTMTIDATDPQGFNLSYQVTCNNRSDVIIEQDTTDENKFHITYPDMDDDDTIYYTITVTNEINLTDDTTEHIQVKAYVPPVIDSITWDDHIHYETETYTLTINAHDPLGTDLSYQVVADNEIVTITQDTNNENKFHMTYGEVDDDEHVNYSIIVTNEYNNSDSSTSVQWCHNYEPPSISGTDWDNTTHMEKNTDTLTISIHDPNSSDTYPSGLPCTCSVEFNNENVVVVVDNTNPNKFHITWPSLEDNEIMSYTIVVTNSKGLSESSTRSVVVEAYKYPIIDSVVWDNDIQEENHSYALTINAHDVYNLDLTYQVTCNDSNVIVTQDTTNKNVFHITYPSSTIDFQVRFNIVVTNTENLSKSITIDKVIYYAYQDRGVFGGSAGSGSDGYKISYITLGLANDATTFGNLTVRRYGLGGTSNSTNNRGVFGGGTGPEHIRNAIDYITITAPGDAQDFGDLIADSYYLAATSNGTNDRGIFGGGVHGPYATSYTNIIQYITISTPGNSIDFGDLTEEAEAPAATSNGIDDRGVFGGGHNDNSRTNVINYITISTLGNAQNFGDLRNKVNSLAATSNSVHNRGVFGGGHNDNSRTNVIDYITISTPGNSIYFGDLTNKVNALAATSNGVHEKGVFAGGELNDISTRNITQIVFVTPGNSTYFGSLTLSAWYLAGLSNAS